MGRRRRILASTDYRDALYGEGDVEIGAWVRRRRRQRVLMSLGGILLVAIAVAVYALLDGGIGHGFMRRYDVVVRCPLCKSDAELRIEFTQTFPLVCPNCGEQRARLLSECRVCGKRFLPPFVSHDQTCPDCGSRNVGSAAVERESEPPGGP